jgi:glycosyltransferase EpsF
MIGRTNSTGILHVVTDLTENGGIATWLLNTAANLPRNRFGQTLLYRGKVSASKGLKDSFASAGFRVVDFRDSYGTGVSGTLRGILALYRLCLRERFSIVHTHCDWLGGMDVLVARIARVRFRILYFHTADWQHAGGLTRRIAAATMVRIGKIGATHFWASSQGTLDRWLPGMSRSKGKVVHGGVSLVTSAHASNPLEAKQRILGQTVPVVGHVGRFAPAKNHVTVVKVFHRVVQRVPEAMLLLVGDGLLRAGTEQLVSALGLTKRVKFAGVQKDVISYLDAMDCFLFPSIFEGLGLAAIEAQCMGLPVVASEIPGLREAVAPEWRKYSALPNDIDRLASSVLKCLGLRRVRPDRFLAYFSMPNATERLRASYEELLST